MIAKARWLDFREFVCGRLPRHGFIAHDARMAREAALAAFSVLRVGRRAQIARVTAAAL